MTIFSGGTDRPPFYGKYRGTVQDNEDPLRRARVRALVPDVLGELPTSWALPCVPYAGDGSGLHLIPPVGAAVWIEFEAGDPDRPIWTGGWWRGEVLAEESDRQGGPARRLLRSETGLIVALDDDEETVTLGDASGTNLVTIQVRGGEVRIDSSTRVVVESPEIELVDGSVHPVVFGDLLVQYLQQLVSLFNAHLHVGETVDGGTPVTPAPPAASMPPPTPGLLSTRVRSG